MSAVRLSDEIARAGIGDGSYAGARKLYLSRGLAMTLIERLRAVEHMAQTAAFVRDAATHRSAARK